MPKIQKKTKSNNVLKFSFTETLIRLCLISYSQRSVLQDEGHLCHTASWSCLDVLLSGEVRLPLKAAYTRR